MISSETYEVYALKYGGRSNLTRKDSYLLEPYPDVANPIDYFIWIIRNENRTIIVDTGFDAESAARLKRDSFNDPPTLLREFGIEPGEVETLIITHMHFDHVGSMPAFPKAQFHLQRADIAYATGPMMNYDFLRYPYEKVQVAQMVEYIHAGRVNFHDGDGEVAPGITVHRVDGHAVGQQAVRINTKRGWVVLASDAAPWAEHFLDYRMSPILTDAVAMLKSYDILRDLASSEDHIITGHDPLICTLYPPVPDIDAPVYRVDVPPSQNIREAVKLQKAEYE